MTLPGVYSVMVPPPSVVVVVVVVLEVCAQANGATNASAMLNIVFFILSFPLDCTLNAERQETARSPEQARSASHTSDERADLVLWFETSPVQPNGQIRFYYRSRVNKGAKMRPGVGSTGELGARTYAPRAKRRLNGMGSKAGVPDPPKRGQFMRTIALLDAALRVWEAKKRQGPPASVWRRPRDRE